MLDQFVFKLLISFFVGTAFAASTLYSAQRFGPRTGGMIAGLPSTVAAGLFFIGYTQTPEAAATASTIVPAAVAASLVYVMVYVTLCKKTDYLYSLAAALAVWFAIALPLTILRIGNLYLSSFLFVLAWIASIVYLKPFSKEKDAGIKIVQTGRHIISRSLFAGCVIMFAVYASNVFGPLWGGVFASFPALFSSMFFILGRSYGCAYTSSIARNTPLGLLSVFPYVWGVYYFYPRYGIVAGTLLSYFLAFAAAAVIYGLSNRIKEKK